MLEISITWNLVKFFNIYTVDIDNNANMYKKKKKNTLEQSCSTKTWKPIGWRPIIKRKIIKAKLLSAKDAISLYLSNLFITTRKIRYEVKCSNKLTRIYITYSKVDTICFLLTLWTLLRIKILKWFKQCCEPLIYNLYYLV